MYGNYRGYYPVITDTVEILSTIGFRVEMVKTYFPLKLALYGFFVLSLRYLKEAMNWDGHKYPSPRHGVKHMQMLRHGCCL